MPFPPPNNDPVQGLHTLKSGSATQDLFYAAEAYAATMAAYTSSSKYVRTFQGFSLQLPCYN